MSLTLLERVSKKLDRTLDGWTAPAGLRRIMDGKITCLLYHRVVQDHERPWIEQGGVPVTRPSSFEHHLKLLKEIGCRFFTLQQIAAGQYPEPDEAGVVVTFDDGFADNFRVAQPMLDQAGISAVFFVTSGLMEAVECNWDHQICWYLSQSAARDVATRLVKDVVGEVVNSRGVAWTWRHLLTPVQVRPILHRLREQFGPIPVSEQTGLYGTWDDLRKAVSAGHEIGSHTVNHPMRHTLTQSEFETELVESKQCLERHLGSPVTSFSFPFNSFLFSDAELCQRCGYSAVATVESGRLNRKSSLLEIPRRTVFRVHNDLTAFKALLCQERWAS